MNTLSSWLSEVEARLRAIGRGTGGKRGVELYRFGPDLQTALEVIKVQQAAMSWYPDGIYTREALTRIEQLLKEKAGG